MPGIHQRGGIGVFLKIKKGYRKIVEVTDSCFKIIWYQNHRVRVYFDLTQPRDINKLVWTWNVLITLIAKDYVFSRLVGNGEEERKRHALALEKYQKARDEWNKRKVQKAKNKGRTIWYAEIKNVLIEEDIKIWSGRGYN